MRIQKLLALVVSLAILLAGFYLLGKREPAENPAQETTVPVLLSLTEGTPRRMVFEAEENVLTLEKTDDTWRISEFPEVPLNQAAAATFVSSFGPLNAADALTAYESKSLYGLDAPQAQAVITAEAGGETTLFLGSLTTDGAYYYTAKAGDERVYLISKLAGDRFFYTVNNFADKSLPVISPYEPTLVHITQTGGAEELPLPSASLPDNAENLSAAEKTSSPPEHLPVRKELLIVFEGDQSEGAENLSQLALHTLTMKKPVDGLLVYPTNLHEFLLKDVGALTLIDLAAPSCTDLSPYGLDAPFLTISLADMSAALALEIGNEASEDTYYCKKPSEAHVYTISKQAVAPFVNVDYYKFVQRFVAYHLKNDLKGIVVETPERTYDIVLEKEAGAQDVTRHAINGNEADSERFGPFYELLVGLSFDRLDLSVPVNETDTPALRVTFKLADGGSETVCRYYDYDSNYYAAEKNGRRIYLVNKQSVRAMLQSLDGLTASE